jgi:hypothetical protein
VKALVSCPRCPNTWRGTTASHCTVCHETFSSDSAGDRHRTGPFTHEGRVCLPPASIGLAYDATRAVWKWSKKVQGEGLAGLLGVPEGSGNPMALPAPQIPPAARVAA